MSKSDGFRGGLGVALRLGTELFVATGLGSAMGYAVDNFLRTTPWFLVLGVFFGAGAGCLGAYRASIELERKALENDQEKKE
tara:strand:- start:219 stop:464 length:246 start_codon:yes stop_codon:yes gene_type:complete